ACGAAAAIGASFNTPIAGVIFAMEVVIMEYTVIGFIPVILAAVSATTLSQLIFGNAPVFNVPDMSMASYWELPYLALLGSACGLAALLFMRIQLFTQKLRNVPVLFRFTLAGLLTGTLAIFIPGIMGIGYDSVNAALSGNTQWQWLLALCLAKIIASAVSNGVGMPIGIVGPSLFIGATVGGCLGYLGSALQPDLSSGVGFYALLGMGGVMGALLSAPLAAIIAILELAHTPEALLPGIIVIVIATLCTDQIFGQQSAIAAVLQRQGINLNTHPVEQALNRIGLSAVCDRNIERIDRHMNNAQLHRIASEEPRSIIVQPSDDICYLVTRKDYLQWFAAHDAAADKKIASVASLLESFTRFNVPLQPLKVFAAEATVTEAREALRDEAFEGLYVVDQYGPLRGILRKNTLEKLIASW
ncbi:MAG: chloride channel protein, partial [Pseudomonadales bacterium]|nr:chloride channel protein [Pseudomonadales bacterium]